MWVAREDLGLGTAPKHPGTWRSGGITMLPKPQPRSITYLNYPCNSPRRSVCPSCPCFQMGKLGSGRLNDVPTVTQLIRALGRQAEARPEDFSHTWRGHLSHTFFFSTLSRSSRSSTTTHFPFTPRRVQSS